MQRFVLRKWYLDVTDDAGRWAIAYWTAVEWGPVALRWESVSAGGPGGAPLHRSTIRGGREPSRSGGTVSWRSEVLGCRADCAAWCRPYAARLLDEDSRTLDWTCEAPGASVRLEDGNGRVIEGAGYAERIDLSIPPWQLPIDELRWGRWVSPGSRRSIAWIDWRGAHPLTIVLADGARVPGATVTDDLVRTTAGTLRLTGTEILYERTLSDILGGLHRLSRRLPGAWRALEDRKLRSVGELGAASGWAIHELVRFP